ncbi:MAG TPA: hypothetical protein VLK27_12090 [Chthoniobacterales bacterium]|nr:hypothetical protein [Chthoniobacterales bacterium]
MHWNDDSEGWLGERVAERQRLLLNAAAAAEVNADCPRRLERRLRQRRAHAGRVFALVVAGQRPHAKAKKEKELLRLVAGVFRN